MKLYPPPIGQKSHNLTPFRSIILSILTYASMAWVQTAKTRETLQLRENISLRYTVNVPLYVRTDSSSGMRIRMRRIRARKAVAKFGYHPNGHLRKLLNHSRFVNRYKSLKSQILECLETKEQKWRNKENKSGESGGCYNNLFFKIVNLPITKAPSWPGAFSWWKKIFSFAIRVWPHEFFYLAAQDDVQSIRN